MHEPSFWWREAGPVAGLLMPVAALYGAFARARMARPGRQVDVPVICVGNLTLGGAGKTPTAIAIARLLQKAGLRPVFLTRGYGGRLKGPVLVQQHRAVDVGDEPLLLAKVAPTIVAHDRFAGARAAVASKAQIVVMDDGFQNPALAKDLALLVIDGRRGVGNGRVFPAGPLRAPLEAQMDRAHALLVIGKPSPAAAPALAAAQRRQLAILHAHLAPDAAALTALAGQRVLAFAGIADPEKFFATLHGAGVRVAASYRFDDHHRFTVAEADALLARARQEGLTLVTTEKDRARMQGDPASAELARRTRVLPVHLVFDDETEIQQLLQRIARRG